MKRSKNVLPGQSEDTAKHEIHPRRRRVALPVLVLLVVSAAIGFDVWSQHRTFLIFGQEIPAVTVASLTIESQAVKTTDASAPVIHTVSDRPQILHLLNLLSQAKLSKHRYPTAPNEFSYLVYIRMSGEPPAVYSLYRIHRFPLQVIAVVGKHTYACPNPLARELQSLTR